VTGMTAPYNWDAKDYAKNSANQQQWAQELIPKLHLKGNETLLDIGCGDGKITAELAKCLPKGRAVGIDSALQMVNLAKAMFPSEQYRNLSFQCMDARQLTFREDFDIAFSNAALHWIVDHKPVLAGVARSLKHRGRLLFQMGGKGNAKEVLCIIDEMATVEPWRRYLGGMPFPYGFFDEGQYRAFLTEAGLVPLRVELLPRDMKHKGVEGLAGWVRTTKIPFTDRLPEKLRADFVDLVVTRYLQKHPADLDGIVHVAMMRIEVEAYKP
jgi:trans-aconitate 2-methyltransferase